MLYRRWFLVAMLAVAGILTAMAYDHANIGNQATAAVVWTDSALLALSCVEHDGDEEFCIMDGGNLNLNFGQVAPSAPIWDEGEVKFHAVFDGNHWKLFAEILDTGEMVPFSTFHSEVSHNEKFEVVVEDARRDDADPTCWHISWIQYHQNPNQGIHKQGEHRFCPEDGSGIQPGASYSFFDLIEITNNSHETIQVAISLSPSLANSNSPLGITVTSKPEGAGTDFFPGGEQHKLNPGESVRASFELTLGEDWNGQSGSIEGSITVTSTVE